MKQTSSLVLGLLTFLLSVSASACFTPPHEVKGTKLKALAGYVSNESNEVITNSGIISSLGIDYEVVIATDSLNNDLKLTSTVIYNPKTHQKVIITKVTDLRLPQPRGSVSSAGMSRASFSVEFGKSYTQGRCGPLAQ